MALYKKTVRTGKFLKAGEDFSQGENFTILNEGTDVEGTYGIEHQFKVRTAKGEEGTIRFNGLSINNMIDAYGEDSKAWVNQPAKIWLILQNVKGKMRNILYVAHPDATINSEGDFAIPGKQQEASESVDDIFDELGIGEKDID